MSLAGTKTKARRVMGIDCSTYAFAFCIYEDGKPVRWGKVNFNGSDVYERLHDARVKLSMLAKELEVDYIAFEAAIGGKSQEVAIKLAYVYGAVIAELMRQGTRIVTVYPITWQTYIGVPNLKPAEKELIKQQNPDRKQSWYLAEGRKIRKQRIKDFAHDKWSFWDSDDEDVCDAHGIAYHAWHVLTSR